MFNREIGKVVAVDSFRLIIELSEEIKGTHKSGYYDIYEVAKVNSYIIVPVGSDKIIALITRVKTFEENDFEKFTGEIKFSKSKRHLIATMMGTINEKKYIDGIYNYPILDNPVWYIIKDDLETIFDISSLNKKCNYEKDFYLPIGKISNFPDYDIKINPDKFFTKHAAILGNTGSGKSCTIASILQSLFNYNYSLDKETDIKLKNATIIIFDTNGEYKKAFEGMENINALTITEEGLKVPYWFMNYDDFDYLFEPSLGTQAPMLKKALSISKNGVPKEESSNKIHITYINQLLDLKNLLENNGKELQLFLINKLEILKNDFSRNYSENFEIIRALELLEKGKKAGGLRDDYGIKGSISTEVVKESFDILEKELNIITKEEKVLSDFNIDIPKYFDFSNLIHEDLDKALDELGNNNSKNKEYISGLKMRLLSFSTDLRKAAPLMFGSPENSLINFLEYIFGNEITGEVSVFSKYKITKDNSESKNQVIILDLSIIPFELLETITGLVGRLILEFTQRINKVEEYKERRGEYPIAIILEEAQNYIPEIDKDGKKSIAKKIFERIAREGRKFGVSLIISSQRPSELSKTILSQCNTFVVHKLQNPEDQRYIRQIVSSANEDLLNQLPILPPQHAIIMGEAVRTPIQIKINEIKIKPDSNNPKIIENWLKSESEIKIDKVIKKWQE